MTEKHLPHNSAFSRRAALAVGSSAVVAASAAIIGNGAAAATAWRPSSLPGLDLWLDFDDGTWARRQIGAAKNLSSGVTSCLFGRAASAPIGPRAGLQLDGHTCIVLTGAPSVSQAMTVAVVLQPDVFAGAVLGPGSSIGSGFELRIEVDGTVTAARTAQADIGRSTIALQPDRPNLVVFQYDDNGIWCCFINGKAAGTGRTTWSWDTPAARVLVGASAGTTTAYRGRLGEVMRWRRPLLGSELRQLHDAMTTKWGTPGRPRIDSAANAPLLLTTPLKGSNIAPKMSMYNSGAVWTEFWAAWDWDWVRSCVDVAMSAGSNSIRTIGDVAAVNSGRITQQDYLQRLEQLIEYCSTHGLRYYPCGFSLQEIASTPVDSVLQQLTAQARLFSGYPNTVVAFDLVNELATNYSSRGRAETLDLAVQLLTAVRAAAPTLPLTVSDIGDLVWGVLSRGTPFEDYATLAPHLDFFDIHAYAPAQDLRPWQLATYELSIERPLMIGEFGIDAMHNDASTISAYYDAVRMMRDSSPSVVGVMQWAAVDDAFGIRSETESASDPAVDQAWSSF